MTRSGVVLVAVALAGFMLAGAPEIRADGTAGADYGGEDVSKLSAVAQLGAKIFFDPSLSSSGRMSCATCHDPGHAYAPANDRVVQLGGPALDRPGMRTVPSLAYKLLTPVFSLGPPGPEDQPAPSPAAIAAVARPAGVPKAASTAADMVPQGGLFWDGRADTLEEQTLGPLLSPFEMDNPDAGAVYAKLVRATYAAELPKLFGAAVPGDQALTLSEAEFALARYQVEEPGFHAFTAKYDAYLAGKASLTPAEARGLKLFDDPKKGNCAACHLDKPSTDGTPPVFTDYEYEALGVPRNPAIPANADPHVFDLGICGPLRDDAYARQAANCGLFKTPTLRNVATRHVFFHNGVYANLRDVVRFYVLRETEPEKVYPKGPDGTVEKYDDLPAAVPHQHRRDRRALRPQARRPACPRRRRDRRPGGVPRHAHRRVRAVKLE